MFDKVKNRGFTANNVQILPKRKTSAIGGCFKVFLRRNYFIRETPSTVDHAPD
jgi:hypothetical protein